MAKKVILIILGILLGLCGIGSLCVGGLLLGIGGASGSFHSDYETIATSSIGFVSDPARVENSQDTRVSGTGITLKIQGRNGAKPLFFGVGPAAQVDAYLAGSPYEHVTDINLSPFKITSNRVDGTAQPAAPGDQSFWVAKASGTDPSLSWKFTTGDYEAVLMNADGTPGFRTQARLGVDAPILGKFAIAGLIVGVIAALGGLALLIWGIRTKRAVPATASPYPASYGPAGVYPAPAYQPPAANQPRTDEGYQPPAGYQPPSGYEQPGAYPPVPPPPTTLPPAAPPPPSEPDATSPRTPPDDPTAPPKP